MSWGSTWCILKPRINVAPTIGVSNFPQVSHAQWSNPEEKSTTNWAIIKPKTVVSGLEWNWTVDKISLIQISMVKIR